MTLTADTTMTLAETFKTPPAEFRPMPLWVWNGDVSEARIEAMIDQFAANGIGGVFIHARPGLITEYLSERWFELWRFALDTCARRGLECHVYDENSFPSGFAGGHTRAADPESLIRSIEPDGQGGFTWGRGKINGWTGHQPLVSLTRSQTVQTFLRVTHEEYAKRFRDAAGRLWKYCFTDEPTIRCSGGLYATPDFLDAFRAEHGYDLLDKLEDYLDPDNARSWPVRFDYWSTANRLYTTNFSRAMYDWCEANGVAFTGHLDEHAWPSPLSMPSAMAAQRWMHMPGIDLLGFQFNPDEPDANDLYLMNMREVTSIARQLNRPRVLCECYGGGGFGYTLDAAKSLSVALLGHGINFLNPHISMQTIAGSRKYDWAQTISDHAPWWPFYRELADHDARASYLLAQSTSCARVLVLQPTVSGWLHAIPPLFREACQLEHEEQATAALRERHAQFLADLANRRVEFDLGDELVMAELGGVEDGKLNLGAATYDAVIVPPGMETMLDSTVRLLRDLLAQQGWVLGIEAWPHNIEGRPDNSAEVMQQQPGWIRAANMDALIQAVHEIVPPVVQAPDGLHIHERTLADGRSMFVIANPGPQPVEGLFRIATSKSLEQWDPCTGDTTNAPLSRNSQGREGVCSIPPRTIVFWMESENAISGCAEPEVLTHTLTLGPVNVERLADNVLVLPVCAVNSEGTWHRNLTTAVANNLMWQSHGFLQDPWEWTIQFRREYCDHVFASDSGYEVEYEFFVEPDDLEAIQSSLKLAVERAWLYTIKINNQSCPFSGQERWLDENIRMVPVGPWIQRGRNTIRLTARPMSIHAEIAPVYVIGNFSVVDHQDGLALRAAHDLQLGTWPIQGLPFYPWAVRYAWTVDVPATSGGLRISFHDGSGSAIRVGIDEIEAGQIMAKPWRLDINRRLEPGHHTITADVYGNLDNLLGPHFRKGLPIPWTWTQGTEGVANLSSYRGLTNYGMIHPPVVETIRKIT